MIKTELGLDEKARASLTFADVIRQTANNYPDPRFRPKIYHETPHYIIAGINPSPFSFWPTADGIGTKPELAERLYAEDLKSGEYTPEFFENLAFDTFAMIDGDEARFGRYLVGIAQVVDFNSARNQEVVIALALGMKAACDKGQFVLLTGETAELGYRTSGYGNTRLNWNAVGISIFSQDKLLLGKNLKPGQPIITFRESSIRSNGLTKAREILETAYLLSQGFELKEEYVVSLFAKQGVIFDKNNVGSVLVDIFGHDAIEQVVVPWHKMYQEITKELLAPSTLYGPIIKEAQGKIDEPKKVGLVAAAHITGGGVPEKGKRMVESKRLGLAIDSVFPDPLGVSSLLSIAKTLPEHLRQKIGIDDRIACEQWNRGIGFMAVTENLEEAKKLIDIAGNHQREAGIAGEIIDKPEIQFKGYKWTY